MIIGLTLEPKTFKASSFKWQSWTTRAWNIIQKFHLEKMKKIFVFRYLEVYFAAIIILQVIRCRHNIVDCHFCLGRRWWECFFIGKLGFLTKWKSTLEIMSNQSCFNIETTVDHLNNVDLLLTGRRKMDDLLHPRLVDAMQKGDRRLKPHALGKKICVKNIFY